MKRMLYLILPSIFPLCNALHSKLQFLISVERGLKTVATYICKQISTDEEIN